MSKIALLKAEYLKRTVGIIALNIFAVHILLIGISLLCV